MSHDWMEFGAEWQDEMSEEFNSQDVRYVCPGVGEVELSCVFGRSGNVAEDQHTVSIETRQQDMIFRRADLDFGGGVRDPESGDEVYWIDRDGNEHRFEVTNQGRENCFDNFDNYGIRIRVHTERVLITAPQGLEVTEPCQPKKSSTRSSVRPAKRVRLTDSS